MITVRPSNHRGRGEHGWLDSRHTFSFADYHDPAHMGFRTLRVINEDHVAPDRGFGLHPHRDMEIFTYLVSGRLAHRDTAGHEAAIGPGEVQFMSAGSGISHSEFNASATEPVHLLQVWIRPAQKGTPPRYEDRDFTAKLGSGELVTILDPEGSNGAIRIGQDAIVHAARPKGGTTFDYTMQPGRGAWVQVVHGSVTVNDTLLSAGDGAAIEDETQLRLYAETDAELLLFDLA